MTRKSLRTKRIFSIILSLAVALTMMPMSALAADESSFVGNAVAEGAEGGAAQIGDTVYSALPEAVNAAQDGDTIKLLADYKTAEGSGGEEASGLTITKSVTLNLNGYEMDDFRVAQVDEETDEVLTSGNLTVEDTSAAQNGKVTGMIELVAGKLTINGGAIGDGRDGVRIENGNLIVNGGTIDFLYGSNSGTVTITGGTVKNARFGPDFEITVTGGSGHTGLWDVSEGTWNISGGAFEGVTFLTASPAKMRPSATISGGTFGKITRKNLQNNTGTLAPISGLLADGYAFYAQAAGSKEYDRCVKLIDAITSLENVQVKGHTHNFVNGVCTVCDYACLHTKMGNDGFCPDCNTQMVAKVEVGGTVTYSADFKEAMKNATNGTKITLLADVSIPNRTGISGDNTTVTLDLNGHKITYGGIDVGGKDTNGTYTACTLKIIGKGSYEPPMYRGIITVDMKATLDLSEWEGGTISSINISDNSNYEAATREAAVIVGPKAGTIGKLSFGNNQLDKLKKTKLSGGSFNEIWVAGFGPVKLGELLADGYAFQNEDGSYVKYETTLQGASIYNVKVVKCLHPNMKPGEDGVATCEYCGKSGKFVASVDGNLYTADQWKDAFKAWLGDAEDEKANGILKLYTDYKAEAADATWSVGYRPNGNTLDLNGHRMSVTDDSAFKPTNNMHLTVTDSTEIGQITNILLDGSQHGSFTLESGYVGNLEMTGGAVVTLKGGRVDTLDVQNCSANTNISIQGSSLGKLNITDWAEGMHVSATSGSLGAYNLPSGKILADVLDHQYYAEGTSLDKQMDAAAQPTKTFDIKQAPYDFGSTTKTAEVPINGSIPFRVDSPSGDATGYYDVRWYRRTNSGAEHMMENRVAGVNVGDRLDVFCVITGADSHGGKMQWQTAVKGYKLTVTKADLSQGAVVFTQMAEEFAGTMGNIGDGKGTFVFTPWGGNADSPSELSYLFKVTYNGQPLKLGEDYTIKDSSNRARNTGTHTLTIEGKENYTGTAAHQWEIKPYTLSKKLDISRIDRDYDGTTNLSAKELIGLGRFVENLENRNSKNPSLGSDLGSFTIRLGAEDFEVSNVKLGSAEAGDTTASFTIKLKPRPGQTAANFVFEDGTSEMTVKEVPVSTRHAFLSSSPKAGELNVANDHAGVYTLDLSKLLPKLESPKKYGEVTYGAPTVNLSRDYYTSGAKVENGKLILPIQAVQTSEESYIGTVKVNVTSGNIVNFPLAINVNATNKIVPTGEPTLSKTTLVWGEQLSTITLSGAMTDPTDSTKTVKGKFEWVTPETRMETVGEYQAEWRFTPTDAAVYAETFGKVTITVTKATPTGTPKYTAITKEGQTLADASLTAVGENNESLFKALGKAIQGIVKWVESDDKTTELNPDTKVEQGKVYTWLFTPTEAANYSTLTGTIVLWAKPSSGGGAVAPAPTTPDTDVVTEKDSQTGGSEGSDTTTKTTVKESRTETAKNEQGQTVSKTTASVSKETAAELVRQATEHKSDTVEITVKSGTTAAEANGVKSTELAIPKTAVEEIAKNTNADLVIKTDSSEVTLDNKTLETIAKEAKGDTVRIVVNENTKLTEAQKPAEKIIGEKGKLFDLAASIGEKLIHHFGGGKAHVTLPMPEKLKGKDVLVIYIDDNGLCKILNHSVEKIGAEDYIRFTTTHFSTFAVVDKDEAERLIKEQNAAHVKELMQSAKFKVTTTKTSKKSVKVTVTAKNNKTLISDIKTMGYTVKYQFYRSTKKASGYKLLKTKTTSSFTNTKGKKGTKYYYKARVLVYDGKTLIAKSQLKQASCGVRTWTK